MHHCDQCGRGNCVAYARCVRTLTYTSHRSARDTDCCRCRAPHKTPTHIILLAKSSSKVAPRQGLRVYIVRRLPLRDAAARAPGGMYHAHHPHQRVWLLSCSQDSGKRGGRRLTMRYAETCTTLDHGLTNNRVHISFID